ncbi:tyrosine-type recombinase/integrase [Streptomyces sp. NPDC058964]|uniref:tyrosine-type recombinase/integrase n=1 Tax=Streptomyces sp. NPDC058964 TaxID=3346681 RepID=UPI003693FF03
MASERKRNPNGAGTITKRKDGRYQCAVYVLQPDGTRARKFAYGKTWAECDTKRRELLAKVDQGVPVPTRSAKLAEWLPYWLEHFIKPNCKRTTFSKYAMHVRLYLVPLLGSKSLEALGPRHVRTLVAEVSRRASPATAKEAHRVLRTALTAACREELVTRNAASLVEAPKMPRRELSPWTLDETLTFLEHARRDPLYAAFVLAVSMGLRRGEILGLRWSDVDLEHRFLRVSKQVQRVGGELYEDTTKSGRARPVPLPLICLAALRWHRLRQVEAARRKGVELSPSSYVFTTRTGRPIDPQNVNRSFFRITDAAGLRRIRLHDARHGCATLLTAAGVAPRVVMEILGHSQISITMDVYTHVTSDTQREAISHMDRLLKRRVDRE